MEINYSPLPHVVLGDSPHKKRSLFSYLNYTVIASIAIILASIVTGYFIVKGPVNKPNRAAGNPVGESCSEATGTCSMDARAREDLLDDPNANWTWTFIIKDTTGEVDNSGTPDTKIKFSSQEKFGGGTYTCDIKLYKDGQLYDPLEADACRGNPQQGSLLCENCACHLFGDLTAKEVSIPDSLGRIPVQTKWNPVDPTPAQCTNLGQTCSQVRIFSDRNHENNLIVNDAPLQVEIVPPSPYSCTDDPHPTVMIHQTKGTESRKYEFIAYDANGNEIKDPACRKILEYSCPLGCGLFPDPDVENPESVCDASCDFTVTGNNNDLSDNELEAGLCADPNKFINLSMKGTNSETWHVSFGDEIDKDDDHEYDTPSARHKYFDNGSFKIAVKCIKPDEASQTCRRVLKMGCNVTPTPTISLTPTVTPTPTITNTPTPLKSPTPTVPACPVLQPINLSFELRCQGECGLTPTPTL